MIPHKTFVPQIYIIPGQVYKNTNAIIGSLAIAFISQINFNKAFIGVNGFRKCINRIITDIGFKADERGQSSRCIIIGRQIVVFVFEKQILIL